MTLAVAALPEEFPVAEERVEEAEALSALNRDKSNANEHGDGDEPGDKDAAGNMTPSYIMPT